MNDYRIKTIILVSCLLLVSIQIIPCSGSQTNDTDWDIIVPNDYPTIQEAINAADDGARILVRKGSYKENIEIKDKSVHLEGECSDETKIIEGGGQRSLIVISTSDVTLKNLSISDNKITDQFGIYIIGNSQQRTNVEINNCKIRNNMDGISAVNVNGLIIKDCIIENNRQRGVFISGFTHLDNPHIRNINISNSEIINNGQNNELAVAIAGIHLYHDDHSKNISIWNCLIKGNREYGIKLQNINDTTINNCSIIGNNNGINLINSHNNIIENCNYKSKMIGNNYGNGIIIEGDSSYNNIIRNCMISNNKLNGVIIHKSYGTIIYNSQIINNQENGIYLINSNNNQILFCNISDSGSNEHVSYYRGNGILTKRSSDNNKIIRCNFTNNTRGITILSSNSNIITQSVFKNNTIYNIDILKSEYVSQHMIDFIESIVDFNKITRGNKNKIYRNSFFPSDISRYARDICINYWNYNDTTDPNDPYFNKNVGNYWYDFAQDAIDRTGDDIIDGYYYVDGLLPIRSINNIDIVPFPSIINFDERPLKNNPQLLDWIPPKIQIIYPNGNEHLFGKIDIIWNAYDPISNLCDHHSTSDELNFSIEIQNKTSGIWNNWKIVEEDLNINNDKLLYRNEEFIYELDTRNYSNGYYRLRINATDNSSKKNTGYKVTYPFTINNNRVCVSKVMIINNEINSRFFVKSGDSISIVADIFCEDVKSNNLKVYADLSAFGKENYAPFNYTNDLSYTWIIPRDGWNVLGNGLLEISVTAQIENSPYKDTNYGYIILDNDKPKISITKPTAGIYFNNLRTFPNLMNILPFSIETIVFGRKMTMEINISDNYGVSLIQWTINGVPHNLAENKTKWDFSNELNRGRHIIKITAYDNAYNFKSSSVELLVI